ncbi:TetR/AcrR family transcriptional regulator [Acidocella sp. KAb 2-4]|uniref:TetR/AcrR family transcriptional regulator n=1 Tax=Acidocella sp. KAb 2-4 TaxID=2885158 RepID=UPI001D08541D|nr:TetR/AcrR family transcriptional regulator [Acidocella sp. KAb 2-4]MCB5946075.1 TetR/AcrR family transcriptional regulator [Acidocella sp. KAb 2-4]
MSMSMNESLFDKPLPGGAFAAPNPYEPANLHRYVHVAAPSCGKRWFNHQERRSSILAAARRRLVDAGFEGVCFRDIAELCEISVPTIYNIVGDRAEVMNQASIEWVQWLGAAASVQGEGGNKVLWAMQTFWDSALAYPEFTKTAAQLSATPGRPLSDAFYKAGVALISKWLTELRAQKRLRPSISIDGLAWQLSLAVTAGVCNWVFAPYAEARYKRDFANGPGLMLLGAMQGAEVAVVEQALEAILK